MMFRIKQILLILLVLLFLASPVVAGNGPPRVRKSVVYTLATNDNALRATIRSSVSSNDEVYEVGYLIQVRYVQFTYAEVNASTLNEDEKRLVSAHLLMWSYLSHILMDSAVGETVHNRIVVVDFLYAYYKSGLNAAAEQFGWTPTDVQWLWDTERFGPDPRLPKPSSSIDA